MNSTVAMKTKLKETIMSAIIQSGISVFGLFHMDPALFTFLLIVITFGGLNLIEFKRLD